MADWFPDFIMYMPVQRAALACVLCGASCSLLSVFVVLMKMPLIGVSMSHAAFAGAVLGMLLGVNPFLSGFILCLFIAGVLGPLSDRTDMAPENTLGIMFSFLMGLAFLGMGILTRTKADALNLMWGSLLSLSGSDIVLLSLVTLLLVLFVLLFFKEIRLVMFNRRLAAAAGVPERVIYYTMLFLTGAVVSSNLATVGGLLIFALLVQPGATALQLTYNLKHFFVISVLSGTGACISGLIVSYMFNLPSGAAVVLMATIIFAAAYVFSPKRRKTKLKKGIHNMKMTQDEIYRMRKEFFNNHAGEWCDMWYKDHATGRYDKHEKDFERLFSLVTLKPGDSVLDVGCGTGVLVPFILERITTSGTLYELDPAEKMIENNRSIHGDDNVRFVLADAENALLDDASCDAVICFSCFPHFHDKEKATKTLTRILKTSGLFVVSHFDSSDGINKHHGSCHAVMHDNLPDEAEMRKLLKAAGLTIDMFIDEPGFYCIIAKKKK